MSKIEFNLENWEKCVCSLCPVQMMSNCVREETKAMEIIPETKESKMLPDPEMVPGIYCATGKATCTGMDTNQTCQCNTCSLWKEYDLLREEPMGYFCRDGAVK